jgi:hypothetical protein
MGRDAYADHSYDTGDEARPRPAVRSVVEPDHRRWRQVFSGEERQLGLMRRWLAACLPECSARDDVISVAAELGSNAILHTASGCDGWFAVELTRHPSVVRVAVADHGSPAGPHMIEDPDGEHGRGLLLVHGLSARTGVTGGEQGRIVWAEIAWYGPDPDVGMASVSPDEAEIRDGEAALARRFAGLPAWFGRTTREWWALAGPGELVTAPTAPELAALLHRRLGALSQPRSTAAARSRQGMAERGPGLGSALGRGSVPRARPGLGPGAGHRADCDRPDGSSRALGRNPAWPMTWSRSAALPRV